MEEIKKCLCDKCKRTTNHKVLYSKVNSWGPNEYDIDGVDIYCVVQCCGCDEISYLTESTNSEDFIEKEDNSLEPAIFIDQYPKPTIDYGKIEDIYELPDEIRKVYIEVVSSIKNDNLILACSGLRTIIDIICIKEKINERKLIKQIEALKNQNIISESDAELLQGIRNLGNDAAHEGIHPKKETIILATNIIEHIIEDKYIYKHQAELDLQTATYKYEEYVCIILKKMNDIKMEMIFSLDDVLKKEDRRLVNEDLKKYKDQFISDLKEGKLSNIKSLEHKGKIYCQIDGYIRHKDFLDLSKKYPIN